MKKNQWNSMGMYTNTTKSFTAKDSVEVAKTQIVSSHKKIIIRKKTKPKKKTN